MDKTKCPTGQAAPENQSHFAAEQAANHADQRETQTPHTVPSISDLFAFIETGGDLSAFVTGKKRIDDAARAQLQRLEQASENELDTCIDGVEALAGILTDHIAETDYNDSPINVSQTMTLLGLITLLGG